MQGPGRGPRCGEKPTSDGGEQRQSADPLGTSSPEESNAGTRCAFAGNATEAMQNKLCR